MQSDALLLAAYILRTVMSSRRVAVSIICSTSVQIYSLNASLGGSDGKESVCNAGDPGLIPGQKDPLKKGIATHSSVLAWRIPWTEGPGRLGVVKSWTQLSDFFLTYSVFLFTPPRPVFLFNFFQQTIYIPPLPFPLS